MDFKKPRRQQREPDADDATSKTEGAFVRQLKTEMMRRAAQPLKPVPMQKLGSSVRKRRALKGY